MAKTHHRRRHRRANRTRRGGVKSNPVSPRAASAFPDMEAIKARVKELVAQGSHASHVSKKPKGISKKEAAKKRFSGILSGKVKHSDKSAFKGSVISDPQSARERGY